MAYDFLLQFYLKIQRFIKINIKTVLMLNRNIFICGFYCYVHGLVDKVCDSIVKC